MGKFIRHIVFILCCNALLWHQANAAVKIPVTTSGNLSVSGFHYNYSGFQSTQKPFGYLFSGNLTPVIGGVTLPFSFIFTDNSKLIKQPFSQFGISPTYRWIRFYAGHSIMNFSSSTLFGKTILGAGIEMNPKLFRFAAIGGQFTNYNKEDTLIPGQVPHYRRLGFATKIGLGNANNYIDFSYLQAKDDSTSIPHLIRYNEIITPSYDQVFGSSARFGIFRRIFFEADVSGSLFTRDMSATKLFTDSIIISNFKYYKQLKGFLPLNSSTGFFKAIHSTLTFRKNYYSLGIDYKLIDDGYQSMGVDFIQADIKSYQVQASAAFWKNHLLMNGGAGIQQDNVSRQKGYTTGRNIYNMTINFIPNSHWIVYSSFANYATAQRPGKRRRLNDTIRLDQATLNFLITPRYTIVGKNTQHSFGLVYNFMQLADKNKYTSEFTQNNINNANLSYTLSFMKELFNVTTSLNYTNVFSYAGTIENVGVSVVSGKQLFKNKVSINLAETFIGNWLQHHTNGVTNILSFTSNYAFIKHQSLQFSLSYMDGNLYLQKTSEFRVELGYFYNF